MAQFYEGGTAMFDALVYARPHENTLNFLQHQAHNFYNALTETGRAFTDQARAFYDNIGLSYGADQLRALGRTVAGIWQIDDVRPLLTLEAFQHAAPVMRRWVMAEPTLRELYHQQLVDGYSNKYIDCFPKDIGEEHYDYRRAMQGVVVESDDGSWKARTYYEDLVPNDQVLSMVERNDIQNSWDILRSIIENSKDDPTSIHGDERG